MLQFTDIQAAAARLKGQAHRTPVAQTPNPKPQTPNPKPLFVG